MSVAWIGCAAGVAGDMLLGALVDAGADPDEVAHAIAALDIDGIALTFEPAQRCGVRATRAVVVVHSHDEHAHPHRPAREVLELIAAADLPDRVADRATRVYRAIAEVEGEIHGVDPDDVELHEVGALDSIADVVGVCAALESLGVDELVAGPIALGHGTVRTQHGEMPNPVPAVTALLARAGAPVRGIDTTMELATPTGVGLVTVLASSFGALPPMAVRSTGFGAGTADPPGRPNVVQVVVGDAVAGVITPGSGRPARLLAANVDDVTPEVLAHTVGRLLAAGAFDAWVVPIVMKKGRPAHTVHALCDDATFPAVAEVLVRETGTLGFRASVVERWPQRRAEQVVDVAGHAVRVKVAGDGSVKVEHDDAAAAALALGRPLRDVIAQAARSGSS
ncbi:MAG: nickel pincer cofactor biosynthesis protein LarC [Ilumatobacteraceae bacterium]|nr:nickel pincer cofactor biosynthesis protein LarC [Ilumatobacteraceae bacterium]